MRLLQKHGRKRPGAIRSNVSRTRITAALAANEIGPARLGRRDERVTPAIAERIEYEDQRIRPPLPLSKLFPDRWIVVKLQVLQQLTH